METGKALYKKFSTRKKSSKNDVEKEIIVIIIKETGKKRVSVEKERFRKKDNSMELSFLPFRFQLSYLIVLSGFCIIF